MLETAHLHTQTNVAIGVDKAVVLERVERVELAATVVELAKLKNNTLSILRLARKASN